MVYARFLIITYLLYDLRFTLQAKEVKPKEKVEISAEQITFDNRVRQYNSADQKFNYFSSIQLVNKFGKVPAIFQYQSFTIESRHEDNNDVTNGLLQCHHP